MGKNNSFNSRQYLGAPLIIFYSFFTYGIFISDPVKDILGLLTCGFMIVSPFISGVLTILLVPRKWSRNLAYAIIAPLVPLIILVSVLALFAIEIVFCIILASPLLAMMASGAGYITWLVLKRKEENNPDAPEETPYYTIALIALIPFLVTPIETQLINPPTRIETVTNEIIINGSLETVWTEIASVPTIQAEEHSFNFFHAVGLPQPLSATISHEGVGGIRDAQFSDGLSFIETVTEWAPNETIAFDIVTSSRNPLPAPLSEIGGERFEVLDGRYRLEAINDNQVRLTLTSHHRLTTRFNLYGRLWTRWIMSDLQQYIMDIIKVRVENQ